MTHTAEAYEPLLAEYHCTECTTYLWWLGYRPSEDQERLCAACSYARTIAALKEMR